MAFLSFAGNTRLCGRAARFGPPSSIYYRLRERRNNDCLSFLSLASEWSILCSKSSLPMPPIRTKKEPIRSTAPVCRGSLGHMCNLYSVTKGQSAIRDMFAVKHDHAGNLPPLPAVFPDQMPPIVLVGADGKRELVMVAGACTGPDGSAAHR